MAPLLNPDKRSEITDPKVIDRFRRKYHAGQPGECWLWSGYRHRETWYGQFRHEDSMQQAHRIAWRIAFGEIPEGCCVCHRCDNPGCVNPDHLFLGSQCDNMRDCAAKGRAHAGRPRLSDAERAEIAARRRRGERAVDIARAVGITPGYVYTVGRADAAEPEQP